MASAKCAQILLLVVQMGSAIRAWQWKHRCSPSCGQGMSCSGNSFPRAAPPAADKARDQVGALIFGFSVLQAAWGQASHTSVHRCIPAIAQGLNF
eukprot:417671-Pelagomonas_calceolata.AAC.3